MARIRPATSEEIADIKQKADLDVGCTVMTLPTQLGPIKAVIRGCIEVDPIVFPEGASPRMKSNFMRDIETHLFAQGITHYYFNVPAKDTHYIEAVKGWGAEQTSPTPEVRMKKVL